MADRPPESVVRRIEALMREKGVAPPGMELSYQLLSGGNSHITWRVLTGTPDFDLVVKIAQPDGPLAPYDVAHEAAMMRLGGEAGAPAPALIGLVQDETVQLIVMRLVEGDSPSLWEVRDWLKDRPDADRIVIGRNLLATLPALAAAAIPFSSQQAIYSDYLTGLVTDLEQAAQGVLALPASIRAVLGWLLERIASMEAPPVLCHGDYRLGNVVFKGGEVAALLDWERAMPGHPLHDVGFLCLPGMKIGEQIGGVLTQPELEAAWREIMGTPLDLRGAAYFRIVAIFGELCLMVRVMARLAKGTGRLTSVRTLPLIVRLHDDLVRAVRSFDDGDFTL